MRMLRLQTRRSRLDALHESQSHSLQKRLSTVSSEQKKNNPIGSFDPFLAEFFSEEFSQIQSRVSCVDESVNVDR